MPNDEHRHARQEIRAKNLRLAWILASIAAVFFVSFIANSAWHKG